MTSLRNWIYIISALFFGLGSGILSAQYAIQQNWETPAISIGPWQSFKEIGINEANPYALANTSLHGNLKISDFETLYFIAQKDDNNRFLSGNCEYVLEGNIPDARWWSLTVYDLQGRLIDNLAERHSFNNTNLPLKQDAEYSIALAPNARAGNWIPLKADTPFVIMFRLYSPGISSIRDANEIAFPKVKRLACS